MCAWCGSRQKSYVLGVLRTESSELGVEADRRVGVLGVLTDRKETCAIGVVTGISVCSVQQRSSAR